MQSARCPDCGVTLEEVTFSLSDAYSPHVKTGEKREGLLGKLGASERFDVETLMCPECGRLAFYADLESEE
jgi:ribosomal protein S27AE